MPEPNAVSRLLQAARLERGLDLDSLARATGVARNHLIDIESGSGRAFHTVAYCRKAVDMVAREFGLQAQVAAAWRDEDWIVQSSPNPRLASLEASPPTLLPSTDAGQQGAMRNWFAPIVGLIALAFVALLAIGRMDLDSETRGPNAEAAKGPTASPAPSTTAATVPAGPATPAAPAVPAASGSSAAPPVPSAASVAIGPASSLREKAEAAMKEWAGLWGARSVAAYSALYDAGFVGLESHLAVRRQRMTQATAIDVKISELQFRETGPLEITVRFRQIYRSDNYQSDDRKEIVWRQTPQGLKIIAERLVN